MPVSGLLLGLAAPGFGLWWLAWLALIPAFWWARRQETLKSVFAGGFGFGFAFQGLYCLWFFDLHPLTWLGFDEMGSRLVTLAGWLIIAVEGGLLCGMLLTAYRQMRSAWLRICVFPLLWVLAFALMNWTPMALPWGLLEYTQAGIWPLRAVAAVLGAAGVSWLVVLHNAIWAEAETGRGKQTHLQELDCASDKNAAGMTWRKGNKSALVLGPLFLPLLLTVLTLLPAPAGKAPWPLPVAVVQASLPIELIRSSRLTADIIRPAYLEPIRQISLPPGALVVYPEEGVVRGWVEEAAPLENPLLLELNNLARRKNIAIAVGVSLRNPAHRYNAMALIRPDGPISFYQKRRLVPFGEFTPYGLNEPLTQLLAGLNIDYSTPYEAGMQSRPLALNRHRLGGLICFELIDSAPITGGYSQLYKKEGADLLVNISNLGWFHRNPLIEAQFLAIGQMRAAETGLPLVIASNTGISALINSEGSVVLRTDLKQLSQHKSQVLFYNGKNVSISTK